MPHETITLKGHIIDSLLLPKTLDKIVSLGGNFTIIDIHIGKTRSDTSSAVIRVESPSEKTLGTILARLKIQGIQMQELEDVNLAKAPKEGVFPDGFYSTTNLETFVRYNNSWKRVHGQEMDLGIRYDRAKGKFIATPMNEVKKGELFVVGYRGVRITPIEEPQLSHGFRFMASTVSSEKPKGRQVQEVAHQLIEIKKRGMKSLFVLGPAIVHEAGVENTVRLIEAGWVDILFAGNALAAHDIEAALYGTSLGVSLTGGNYAEHGNENHLRAINLIRRIGGIKRAVKNGVLTSGIMYSCVKKAVPFVLAGSIRDDGPLPEVIADIIKAQQVMRRYLHKVGMAVVVGTVLHGIAVGNLLPASVRMVCVDINPASVTKFTDRGSIQCMGIVMDGASFFRHLGLFLKME